MAIETYPPPPLAGEGVGGGGNPWPARRERAVELSNRYPHAEEMLRLYAGLIPVQEQAFLDARSSSVSIDGLAQRAVERVLPSVVDVTVSSGPARLREGVVTVFCSADLRGLVRRWLQGDESLDVFERYLARASASPVLEARGAPPPPPPPPRGGGWGGGGGRGSGEGRLRPGRASLAMASVRHAVGCRSSRTSPYPVRSWLPVIVTWSVLVVQTAGSFPA